MSLPIQIPTSKPSCSDQSTMAGQSSSSLTPHSPFSTLLDILSEIPHPICGNVIPEITTDGVHLEHDCSKASNLLGELKKDVLHIQKSLEKLRRLEQDLGKRISTCPGVEVREAELQFSDEAGHFLAQPRLHELTRAAQGLKNQLPPTSYYELPESFANDPLANDSSSMLIGNEYNLLADDSSSTLIVSEYNPLANNSSSTLIGSEYDNFTLQVRKCLWCFLFFPENAQIKKRVLINWWIGEELLPSRSALEGEGEELLQLLEYKQFIKRVVKKKRGSDSWLMEPSVRSFLSSKVKDEIDQNVMLLESVDQVGSLDGMVNRVTTVFNVNKSRIGESEAKSLASMECLSVLQLGRSQITDSAQNNIRVNNLKLIMEVLIKMKKLRLLSFQGIPSLDKLPASVCRLTGLKVLDLRACQALEALPIRKGDLKNLRHLDMSGCHLLPRMPEGIKGLSNLEVLKGFHVANKKPGQEGRTSTLHHLRMLKKLHKLSILVLKDNFPKPEDLFDLASIKELRKLKILWNPSLSEDEEDQGNADDPFRHFLEKPRMRIKKLDLWCPPKYTATKLLGMSRAFPGVKKLYIRGAEFDHLTYNHNLGEWDKWRVKTLRLLLLPELEMSWEVLKAIYPRMSYLEVQDCPKLQFSQFLDEDGVWEYKNSSPDPVEL